MGRYKFQIQKWVGAWNVYHPLFESLEAAMAAYDKLFAKNLYRIVRSDGFVCVQTDPHITDEPEVTTLWDHLTESSSSDAGRE